MGDRLNTIFGWVLFSAVIALGLSSISSRVFHADNAEAPEKPGYVIQAAEGDGEADAGPSLATLLATGSSVRDAVTLANRAGGIVVGRFGTATVGYEELFA